MSSRRSLICFWLLVAITFSTSAQSRRRAQLTTPQNNGPVPVVTARLSPTYVVLHTV
ncbi:hypothetical protein [Spirosoma montaniterrae]|uniref:hypothetical protein n=1 Tax=Spirosoma montaniterrae TaxID=1178516 RepID=UPI0012FA25D2|nr:hypothetical protein [Spirosoma montaniterrae]